MVQHWRIDGTATDALSPKLDQILARLDAIEARFTDIGAQDRDAPH